MIQAQEQTPLRQVADFRGVWTKLREILVPLIVCNIRDILSQLIRIQ